MEFPRDNKGRLSDNDLYIPCASNCQISYYGKKVLEYYSNSLGRGRNIVKAIHNKLIGNIEQFNESSEVEDRKTGETKISTSFNYEKFYESLKNNQDIIFDIRETDGEIYFKFKYEDFYILADILKPRKKSCDRSPFSTKYIPKSDYKLSDEELSQYKNITANLDCEDKLAIAHTLSLLNKRYLESIANRKHKLEDIKSEMKNSRMNIKQYVSSIEKWDDYVAFLEKELEILK